MTGSEDDNTFAWVAYGYVEALARRGVRARFIPVEGAGHGFSSLKGTATAALEGILAR